MLLKNLIWQEIQTALAATVFTVLVWIYAEGETIKAHDLMLNVRFVAPPGQALVIRPVQPAVLSPVTVRVRCANAQWNEVETWQSKPFDLTLSADDTNAQHEVTVNLLERLRRAKRFTERGVDVREVHGDSNPTLYVESTVSRTFPVIPVIGNLDLQGQPTVDPDKVTVNVPASEASALDNARVEARLDALTDFFGTPLVEGQQITRDVQLVLAAPPGLKDWQIRPDHAVVSFTVRRVATKLMLTAIPVSVIYLSPADTARYAVQIQQEDRFLPELVLTGPRASLDRLRDRISREGPLHAYISLSTSDLEKHITSKTVEIKDLPAGVTITSPVPLPSVRLQILSNKPAAAATPP